MSVHPVFVFFLSFVSFTSLLNWDELTTINNNFPETEETEAEDGTKTILVFGDSGVGKSSVANMIFGEALAIVKTPGFEPKTPLELQTYLGNDLKIYEMPGFNEKPLQIKEMMQVVENLFQFIKLLKMSGVHLLILVTRAERISNTVEKNYQMFINILTKQQVTILLVVNNCEEPETSRKWWEENKVHYDNYGLKFVDVVLVCASQGEDVNPTFAELYMKYYQETRPKLQKAVSGNIQQTNWKLGKIHDVMVEAVAVLFQNVEFIENPLKFVIALYSHLRSSGFGVPETVGLTGRIFVDKVLQIA